MLARAIATTVRLDRELAFLCGQMMDFGKIVLLSLIQEAMEKEPQYKTAPAEVVDGIVEAYHPKLGGVVGERWHLPAAVLETIKCHHALSAASEHRRYVATASLSDRLANSFVQTPDPQARWRVGRAFIDCG